jgi:hypothetical protein
MRTLWVFLIGSLIGAAQTPQAPPIVRGVLLERDQQGPSGEFSVRIADNQVFRFQFDRKTYVERESQMIDVGHLKPGEKVEVVSDQLAGAVLRYARTVHVILPEAPPRPLSQGRLRAARDAADRAIRTGNLTYSGIVSRLSAERLVLRMREGLDQTILLRKDTRYLEDGGIVDSASLKQNMRVFVRAGKDLYDQVEAYQVIWGKILDPK